jgi:site-specific DNA-cytosine methylase
MKKPLAIDLCCGRGGWTDGLMAAGFHVIGFDIERFKDYRGDLVIQDIRTINGAKLKSARLIVASPPCTEFSRFSMPCFFDVKSLPSPDLSLIDACFRISKEAGVPMVLENVRGAQKFIGRAPAHRGSFYLWGEVPILLPNVKGCKHTWNRNGHKSRCGS